MVTWPVGAERTVSWDGVGGVDVMLSVDGGASSLSLASDVPASMGARAAETNAFFLALSYVLALTGEFQPLGQIECGG